MDLRSWKHRRLFGKGIAVCLKHLVLSSLQRSETPCQLGQAPVPGSLPLCAVYDRFSFDGRHRRGSLPPVSRKQISRAFHKAPIAKTT